MSDSQDTLLRAAPQTQHKLLHYMDVVMLCAERCTVPCSATDLVSLFALITTILSSARQPAPEMRYHLHKYVSSQHTDKVVNTVAGVQTIKYGIKLGLKHC